MGEVDMSAGVQHAKRALTDCFSWRM